MSKKDEKITALKAEVERLQSELFLARVLHWRATFCTRPHADDQYRPPRVTCKGTTT